MYNIFDQYREHKNKKVNEEIEMLQNSIEHHDKHINEYKVALELLPDTLELKKDMKEDMEMLGKVNDVIREDIIIRQNKIK